LADPDIESPLNVPESTSKQRSTIRDYIRLGLVAIMVITVFIGVRAAGVDRLQAVVERGGIYAPILYIGLRALVSVVAPFSSGPLQFVSGVLFGFVPAVIYSTVAATIGHSVSYWLARRYGSSLVKRFIGESIRQVDSYIDRLHSVWSLISARIALFFAYDFVAYAAGLAKVNFIRFFVISLLFGAIPTAVTIAFGLFIAGDLDIRSFLPF
jgi:uncharacterized membrane protein YdjX (TVP38/TMEM64 family)